MLIVVLVWVSLNIPATLQSENLSICSSHRTLHPEKYCICDVIGEQPPKCRCTGPRFVEVPVNLTKKLDILVIEDAECMEVLKSDSLVPYASTLRELTLVNLEKFYYFETGVFHHLSQLQTIYIHRAPKLLKIQPDVFRAFLPGLKILRIVNTGLEEMPNLNCLNTTSVLHMIDLEHNRIQEIRSRQVSNVKAEQMLLNFNNIQVVEEAAFAGSQIANLSLKGNFDLQKLHKKAFLGLQSLRYIDLSGTAITFLPVEGLRDIDTLKLQNTKSLKMFPSVFNFQLLKEAWLTYPYHCCAFKYPRTHNPGEFEKHARFVQELQAACNNRNSSVHKGGMIMKASTEWMYPNNESNMSVNTEEQTEEFWGDVSEIKCHPSPDAFNPCEDLMGNWALRIPVWFISLSAVIGNLFVVIVISTSHFRLTVSKFLMCNLAIADLVAGFLTIFGNILSVYTLAVITTERWYTITWAIHLNKRLKLRNAVRVMLAGWTCALLMAVLPLVGVSNYSKTSICLPLENKGKADAIYLSTLLAFNAIAFALICVCYGSMYKSIREGGRTGSTTSVRSDLTVAKRMALLVFTDFACWAPIAFFGLTALLGHPLITVTHTKILLVFFYPLNSCANPCLYALLTQQYRRDFFILMGRYGLCKDRAERHKGAIGGKPLPYGTGPQYKRTCMEGVVKVGGAINHRGSTMTSMTTVVSVECPMMRSSSRNSSKYRPESILALSEFSVRNLNHFHECQKLQSTDNL
ncbi:unnamed protein product [Phaedon cochleariae]|uniref:G-protein coupled receptors family 1 profile domain-containing protein n=1 Tax=Phaedon cochleariae TaxID=80249 RepID=A0A9P0DXB6_PHACE|nr:unnamed protein product [Phaedon cochleariae]